ncbi:hypothetical protein GOODEAATRI_006321 [Goodea atripinnis]|uniref:Uncharacterized protein n=1 Tax=Goodea atripinnis TaxID=208336 RepID=A0ABV0NHX7_9TELE
MSSDNHSGALSWQLQHKEHVQVDLPYVFVPKLIWVFLFLSSSVCPRLQSSSVVPCLQSPSSGLLNSVPPRDDREIVPVREGDVMIRNSLCLLLHPPVFGVVLFTHVVFK